jgi:hypothetical protein
MVRRPGELRQRKQLQGLPSAFGLPPGITPASTLETVQGNSKPKRLVVPLEIEFFISLPVAISRDAAIAVQCSAMPHITPRTLN